MRASDPRAQSVRGPGFRSGGPGTSDPRLIRFSAITLEDILEDAFDLGWDHISGPDWMSTERYEIQALVPEHSTQGEVREMLRNLIVERLHLAYRIETKSFEGYELVRGADVPKLQRSQANPDDSKPSGGTDDIRLDSDGFPVLPRGMKQWLAVMPGAGGPRTNATFKETSMAEFARWLGSQLGSEMVRLPGSMRLATSPVVDRTGLTDSYDFTFWYPGAGLFSIIPGRAQETSSAIQHSVESQLGLKLTKARVPVNNLIIGHVDKRPIEN
jgi:uncharacterized protein (TIGR03435 family)